MAKVIQTILNLKDNMSGGLVKAAKNTKGVSKEMVSATRSVVNFGKKAESAIGGVVKKTVKWGAVTATAVAGLAAKTGLSEAMDLEGYRLQLETATKDTQKASQIMQNAINLANRTPFEGGELVEGAAKFEAMGMSADTWLTRAGDMAAATNKSFDQAVEALIDAQTGELERLKEFGITKAKILEQGEKMFSGVQIANNSGQIVNQEKFNEAMIALMEDRFSGGMEKQATTMRGLWSTVTRFQQWQQDGTIDRIAQKFTDGLGKAVEYAGKAFSWVTEHGDTIKRWIVGLGSAFAMVKVVQFTSQVFGLIKTVMLFGSTLATLVAANPVVLLIGGAIAAGALLIANWDKVKAYFQGLWAQFTEGFAATKESIVGTFNAAKSAISSFFGWFGDKLSWLDDKISKVPILGSLYTRAKSGISGWIDKQFSGINWGFGGHATGTSYFPGGWTRINERGGEIVNLPGGTQIIPHDVSQRMAGGQTVNVYVTVQGNMIGDEAYADYMGNVVAQRLLRALRNT